MKLLNTAKKITTAAALAAALLAGTAPKAAAQCPYTVGPLGSYIAPAIVQGMTATDDGAVEVWCTDALDGDDWFFTVDAKTDLRIFDRVQLVVNANGTPTTPWKMPFGAAAPSTTNRKERTAWNTRLRHPAAADSRFPQDTFTRAANPTPPAAPV